jgi:hypothetical protein
MELEKKVTNLELSKHLKNLGVEQKSLFLWEYYNSGVQMLSYHTEIEHIGSVPEHFNVKFCSAFTSDELMDLLPCFIDTKENGPYNNFCLEIHKRSEKNIQYVIKYVCDTQGIDRYGNLASVFCPVSNVHDEKLADALAKMLILLIEN